MPYVIRETGGVRIERNVIIVNQVERYVIIVSLAQVMQPYCTNAYYAYFVSLVLSFISALNMTPAHMLRFSVTYLDFFESGAVALRDGARPRVVACPHVRFPAS